VINVDGTGLERVSFSNTFESFPMFSPDGKRIAFSSNRNAKAPRETNVFVADWVAQKNPANYSMTDADPANRFMATVQALSAPEMEGRGVGTVGLQKAEKLVSELFNSLGLKPLKLKTETSGFFQKVEFKPTKTQPAHIAQNIVGVWGDACNKTRPIVIGAHMDHLGFGAENSLALNVGEGFVCDGIATPVIATSVQLPTSLPPAYVSL
jgi:hypothetical protein